MSVGSTLCFQRLRDKPGLRLFGILCKMASGSCRGDSLWTHWPPSRRLTDADQPNTIPSLFDMGAKPEAGPCFDKVAGFLALYTPNTLSIVSNYGADCHENHTS